MFHDSKYRPFWRGVGDTDAGYSAIEKWIVARASAEALALPSAGASPVLDVFAISRACSVG